MPSIHVEISTTAAPEHCWALLKDFQNIHFFNPYVEKSYLLDGQTNQGVGTLRQCDFTDGKNFIKERIIDWQENKSFTVEIFDGTLPLNNIKTSLGVLPATQGNTRLFMHMDYTPKWGVLGTLLNMLIMKKQFEKMSHGVLKGLEEKALLAETPIQQNIA